MFEKKNQLGTVHSYDKHWGGLKLDISLCYIVSSRTLWAKEWGSVSNKKEGEKGRKGEREGRGRETWGEGAREVEKEKEN